MSDWLNKQINKMGPAIGKAARHLGAFALSFASSNRDGSPQSEEHWRRFDRTFDRAKRLSDFVGMIIRLSFVQFVTQFLIHKGTTSEHWFTGFVFGMSAVTSIGLSVVLGLHIMQLIILWETRDATTLKGPSSFVVYILGLGAAVCLWLGTSWMVSELAKANSLLQ